MVDEDRRRARRRRRRRPARASPGAGRRRCRRRRRRSPGPRPPRAACAPTAPPCSDDPCLGLGRGAVVDRDLVALGREVAGHRIAHDAETEECDLRHRRSLSHGEERLGAATVLRSGEASVKPRVSRGSASLDVEGKVLRADAVVGAVGDHAVERAVEQRLELGVLLAQPDADAGRRRRDRRARRRRGGSNAGLRGLSRNLVRASLSPRTRSRRSAPRSRFASSSLP